jgi:hypothetical protein
METYYDSQIGEFARLFHQDFGQVEDELDTLENNISSFFSASCYSNGEEFIDQIHILENLAFSSNNPGYYWQDLGGYIWMEELNDPRTWEIIKSLAKDYPNHRTVLDNRDEFDDRLHRLLADIK